MSEPPQKGDWIITTSLKVEDRTITLNGNLVIKGNGRLTLERTTLKVNSGFDGQYKISVEAGGSMYIYGSAITAANQEHRFAFVVSGSAFEMENSELHGVGWQGGKFEFVGDEVKGLLIKTPGAVLENNIISGNFIGTILRGDKITLKGNEFNSNDYQALYIASSGNTITGNRFHHATTFDSVIVTMDRSHNNTITDNTFVQKPLLRWQNMGGISAWHSWNNVIADNTMDVDWPVGMVSSSNNVIRNNTFTVREVAVWLRAGVNNRIENNDIQLMGSVRFGILLIYAHENIVAGNKIWGASRGGYGILYLDHSDRNRLLNNQVSVPVRMSSVFLLASEDNWISGNQISDGEIGLFLFYQADGNKIFGNSIASAQNAVTIDGSSGNLIYQNNLSYQKGAPYDNGANRWDSDGRGNYWKTYQGKDSNGDGIGDTPYSLVPAGEDKYPAIKPVEVKALPVPETKPVSFAQGPQFTDVNTIVVKGEKVIESQTFVIEAGGIYVEPTGSLVIRDSTLVLGGKGLVNVEARGGGSIRIERSIIKAAEDGYGFQLIVGQDSTLVMKDSELHDASWNIGGGLFVERAKSAVIANSVITGSQAGVYLGHVGSARVVNSTFKGTYQGIFVDTSSNVIVEGNTVDGFIQSGVDMMDWEEARDVMVANNTILNGWGTGMIITSNSLVENNRIESSPSGISIKGDNNIIRGNSILNSGGGLWADGKNNLIYQNNLFSGQAGDNGSGNRWDDGSKGNYWSNYTGKDANGDGIGDTPYTVPPNGVDRYPLTKRFE
ncbi:MAG: right-handed parallel beta-helix repeat-containing protein [Chloroflexi bacterium]|nr:right-handed parallel beta-helix repeat-containing protein [Chloroflexota bacterium]